MLIGNLSKLILLIEPNIGSISNKDSSKANSMIITKSQLHEL